MRSIRGEFIVMSEITGEVLSPSFQDYDDAIKYFHKEVSKSEKGLALCRIISTTKTDKIETLTV